MREGNISMLQSSEHYRHLPVEKYWIMYETTSFKVNIAYHTVTCLMAKKNNSVNVCSHIRTTSVRNVWYYVLTVCKRVKICSLYLATGKVLRIESLKVKCKI